MEGISILDEILMTYRSLCWFISMATMNLLHPIMPLAIIVPLILGVLPVWSRSKGGNSTKKDIYTKRSIALMPFFWVTIGIWGGAFRRRENSEQWSSLIADIPFILLALFLIYGLSHIMINKGHRVATTLFFIINTYYALFVSLCSTMSITGDWL